MQRDDFTETEATRAMEKKRHKEMIGKTRNKVNRPTQKDLWGGNRIPQTKGTNAHLTISEKGRAYARRNGTQQGQTKTTSRTHDGIPSRQKQQGESDAGGDGIREILYMPELQTRIWHDNGENKPPTTPPEGRRSTAEGGV